MFRKRNTVFRLKKARDGLEKLRLVAGIHLVLIVRRFRFSQYILIMFASVTIDDFMNL